MSAQEPAATILIVDDVTQNIQVVANILQPAGYQMAFATDGKSALETLESHAFDLILLDVSMPGMDGFEVCRQVRQNPATADIPVIFLTARNDSQSLLQGFEAGGVDYITKPFQAAELLARVSTHLRLRHTEQALRSLNASKDKFLSIIAHDLRGPFGVVLQALRSAVDGFAEYPPAELHKLLKDGQNAAQNFYRLLENLLTWSRLQRGSMEYHPVHLDLSSLAVEMQFFYRHLAADKNIRLHNHVAQGAWVRADQDMLRTVLRNLVSNAVKFTPQDGEITLSARRDGDQVEVAVQDTGIGISAEDQAKLFRIDVTFKRAGTAGEPGTGMGLIFCQDMIEKHGGRIWVESAPGQGSTFRFSVPGADGAPTR